MKYGIIFREYDSSSFLFQIEYDNIEALEVNNYLYGVDKYCIRITQNGKSFLFGLSSGKKSKIYDNIIVPPQPLSQWIVELNHKYGLINLLGEEIVKPIYESMSDLCSHNGLSLRLQTENLYENRDVIKIKRIIEHDKHRTTFIDESGMIKGNFCYHEELYDSEGTSVYKILKFPSLKEERIAYCNRFGYYFNIFDANVFDFVECLSTDLSLYLCEKNGRYGLMDNNLNTILDLSYKEIRMFNQEQSLLLVTTDLGMFIYDIKEKTKSATYEFIYGSSEQTFIFKSNNKYGIIDKKGTILVRNNYAQSSADESMLIYSISRSVFGHPFVLANFAGKLNPIYVENGKYYGWVDLKYDECIKLRSSNIINSVFFIKKNDKYGIFNGVKEILEPIYDEIIFFNEKPDYSLSYLNNNGSKHVSFIILRKERSYCLFNLCDGKLLLSECEEIRFVAPPTHCHFNKYSNTWAPSVIAKKNGKYGLYDKWGTNRLGYEWDCIVPGCRGFIVSLSGKKGYYTFANEWMTDCVYDDFKTAPSSVIGIKDGKEEQIEIGNIEEVDDYYKTNSNRRILRDFSGYKRYSSTWAQDEMGYRDDEIDTIFDGDPDAYWNID